MLVLRRLSKQFLRGSCSLCPQATASLFDAAGWAALLSFLMRADSDLELFSLEVTLAHIISLSFE